MSLPISSYFPCNKVHLIGDLQLLGGAICLGACFVGQKGAMDRGLDPIVFNCGRLLLGTVAMVPVTAFLATKGKFPYPPLDRVEHAADSRRNRGNDCTTVVSSSADVIVDDLEITKAAMMTLSSRSARIFIRFATSRKNSTAPATAAVDAIVGKGCTNPNSSPSTSFILLSSFLSGCIMTTASSLLSFGLIYTSAGMAAFITGSYVIIMPLLGILLKQATNWATWLSALISLGGLYLISVDTASSSNTNNADFHQENFFTVFGVLINKGDVILLCGAVLIAASIHLTDYLVHRRGLDPSALTFLEFSFATILAFASAPLLTTASAFDWGIIRDCIGPILGVGILEIAGYTLCAYGQQAAHPSHAGLITVLEAPFAVLFGIILLSEFLNLKEAIGCAVMFAAVVLSVVFRPSDDEVGDAEDDTINEVYQSTSAIRDQPPRLDGSDGEQVSTVIVADV